MEKNSKLRMTWDQKYELAKKYYEHYGNLNVPYDFKTKNGIDNDVEGFPLGWWIVIQRQCYKGKRKGNLTPERIKKLDDIEMIWFGSDRIDEK